MTCYAENHADNIYYLSLYNNSDIVDTLHGISTENFLFLTSSTYN